MNEPQTFVDLQDAGNAQAQLILQAIARHADWDTGSCYPSQTALARMAKCNERTIRRYLSKLESDGLIVREERRKDNGAQMSDLITLNGYAEWIIALREGGKVAKPKAVKHYEGADNLTTPPADNLSAPPGHLLSAPPGQQVSAYKEPSLNNQNNKSAQAREVSKSGLGSEVKASPQFTITPSDPQWRFWIDHIRESSPAKADDAEAAGSLIAAGSRWPDKGRLVSIPNATLTQRSKAMTGENAA
jgi:hypothetical protein